MFDRLDFVYQPGRDVAGKRFRAEVEDDVGQPHGGLGRAPPEFDAAGESEGPWVGRAVSWMSEIPQQGERK